MAFLDGELMANSFYHICEGYPHHALIVLDNALKKYPNDPIIKLHLGIILVIEDRLQEAFGKFNDLKDKEDFTLSSLIAIVHVHKKLSEIDQDAVNECESKIRDLRRHASDKALYFAALVLFFFGRYEKAKEYVERSLKGNLLFREALSLYGWIDLMGKDETLQKKALKYFEESTHDQDAMSIECLMGKIKYFQKCKAYSSALDIVNIAIVNFQNFIPALIEKMKLELIFQDWEQTADMANRCITLDPTCIEAFKFYVLYLLCFKGNSREAFRKLQELESILERFEPNSPKLYYSISKLISVICGRDPLILEKLILLAERAVNLAPRNHSYLINLGHIHLLQERTKEAFRYFRNALNICETNIVGLEAIIRCQLVQGSLQEASTQLEFLEELQPTIGKSAEVNYLLAIIGRKQNASVAKVISHLDEAVELHFQKIQGLSLGPEYFEILNPDFLVQIVNEYLVHAPPRLSSINGHSNISVGIAYPNDNVLMKCLQILERLNSAAPGFQQAIYLLAHVHYLLGHTSTSLHIAKSCLEINSSLIDGYILLARSTVLDTSESMTYQLLSNFITNTQKAEHASTRALRLPIHNKFQVTISREIHDDRITKVFHV